MKSLQEFILEVSSDLAKRAADKALELSKNGPNRERKYRGAQAEHLYTAFLQKLKDEHKSDIKNDSSKSSKSEKTKVKNVYELEALCDYRLQYVLKYNKNVLDLTDIDVSNLKEIQLFRNDAKSIDKITIDVSGWNTKNCESMSNAFHISSNKSFKEIKGLETWNVSNVTSFVSMFDFCTDTKITGINNWDVSNGIYFSSMFRNCQNLNVNLSKWNFKKGRYFTKMFYYSNITKNDIGDNFEKRLWEIWNIWRDDEQKLVNLFDENSNVTNFNLAKIFDTDHDLDNTVPSMYRHMINTINNIQSKSNTKNKNTQEKNDKSSNLKLWTAKEVYYFVSDIISNNYVDEDEDDAEEINDYYNDANDQLKDWLKKNKNNKYKCYTSTGDYWGFKDNEYEECDEDDIDDAEGPDDGCGLSISGDVIIGKSNFGDYGSGDYFDFKFEKE